MATVPELLVAVFATASVVLLATILHQRSLSQPLKSPAAQTLTRGVDDNPAETSAPKTKKSLTLRIDEIPADHANNLNRNLKSILGKIQDLRGETNSMVCRSLVSYGKDYLCATISINTSLFADDLSAQLCHAGQAHPYKYTCKFQGVTPLFEDKNGADIDVIAVPGLGSHALGSWKSPNNDDVWLRDFLPKDVPNIRVLLYGYDTSLQDSRSNQSMEDLGQGFLEKIIAFRANDGALIRACKHRHNQDSDLSKASFGMLFFGVPNLGLRNEELKTIVRGQPNDALIYDLVVNSDSEPSTSLKRQAREFSEDCKCYRVVTFFERNHSPLLKEQDGELVKSGSYSLLVTEKSASSIGLVAVAEEDKVPLNTDHSGLVKYESRTQDNYTIVRERLGRLVDEARPEVARRFVEHSLYGPQSETTKACLKSLAFEDMDGRQVNIPDAADGTCKWLLNHETLIKWIHQDRGLLWIKGKPGSGKSTLVKYAKDALPPIYDKETLVFSFFFHGRGHELQKSPIGLFRCLLHQLLKCVPGAVPDLIKYFDDKRATESEPGEKWQWHLQLLQSFLKSSLTIILKRFPVILFIDALDECGKQSAAGLVEYFERLRSNLPPTDARFGIFFSCRHYPILQLKGGSTISLDTAENADITADITTYIQGRFKNDPDVDVENLISDRAQGVFLWAHLVVERVLLLKREGESRAKIKAEIERIPQEVGELYRSLMRSAENASETLKLMQWICFSTRPLTTDELQWAMVVGPDDTHKSLNKYRNSDEFIADDKIDIRISALSRGLAEIVRSRNARVVQFIHQSVQDFLVEGGLNDLDNTTRPAHLVVSAVHCRLSRSCIRYFRMVVSSQPGSLGAEDESRFPLLHYATTSWVSHVKLGDPAEESPNDLMHRLGWPTEVMVEPWVRTYKALERYARDCPPTGSNLVYIGARHGLTKLLSCLLLDTDRIDIDARDTEYGRTPLSWAAENGYQAVVKMILDTGKVDIDARDKNGRTPLSWAAERGHEAVVKMILDTGKVDIDARDKNGRTPLSWAAERGHEAVVKMILDTGKVDIDVRDINGRTPLSWAAERGHEAVVKMLLDTNKVDIDIRDTEYGQTPLSWAAERGHEAVVKMILDTGKFDIDVRDINGRTPLSWAAERGHEDVVKMLLDTSKVDIDIRDTEYGQTPLSWAAEKGHEAVVKMLLNTGKVDIDARDTEYGQTPLLWAVVNGHEAVVKMLLNTGKVDIDARDTEYGRTPLLWAAAEGGEAVVKMLLNTGKVDIDARDTEYGWTPPS
ncbi:Ankyrin repeat domain-containing protein 50 [Beauveria bassiana]|uniref:Ankyrin repeat domain-containing protein 50 n=1 Tax=Beauveria bassiana TaxID=176275 RepID=A0A2N6NJV2_BEABA|nr:Ankyrin repeat domain-containing protein 50 [Beauveria bassiana]